MNNFTYHIPTKVFFGQGVIENLPAAAKSLGTKALLVYGGGSIKKNGLYDSILSLLKEIDMPVYELSGVEPNPRIESVRAGIETLRENGIDLIIAAGGGSAMDCAKAIAAGAHNESEAWDVVMNPALIDPADVPPIIAIPTLSATGSEMDEIGVISNLAIPLKKPLYHACLRPAVAIMDPVY
ncbi:MAG: iron-containing alcohol dehydrogenase, partial [Christensenellaceae bacterium]|nr:iron-containing alcohol dehydrogenase [Christensenellaceae bacterium]